MNWRGHSDTETLLTDFDAWGIEATEKNHGHVCVLKPLPLVLKRKAITKQFMPKPLLSIWVLSIPSCMSRLHRPWRLFLACWVYTMNRFRIPHKSLLF